MKKTIINNEIPESNINRSIVGSSDSTLNINSGISINWKIVIPAVVFVVLIIVFRSKLGEILDQIRCWRLEVWKNVVLTGCK